ncbi:MAG: hypothetical protein IJO70_11610 [Lachnospiraceae bacterium]|nr:hypothetical protein [Lachnospiraceae bacterium]
MEVIIKTEELKKPFSDYPKEMDEYFLNNEITIKAFPDSIVADVKDTNLNFRVTSTKQYYEYLTIEQKYWTENDEKGKLSEITGVNAIKIAITDYNTSLKYYKESNIPQGQTYLLRSINRIQNGVLKSKSNLAEFLLYYKDREDAFIKGLRYGFTTNGNSSISTSMLELEGVITAFSFRGIGYGSDMDACNEIVATLDDSVVEANSNYSKLNEDYTRSFHELQEKLKDITEQTNTHINNMNDRAQQYFNEKEKRCNELELLYGEKLHLEKPAQYWEELEINYRKSGKWWFIASCIIAAAIMGGLVVLLIKLPDVFTKDAHWFDLVKNSAIITVIASVAIYILRTTMKMAMSSLHLARDAKERNMLTYFYLSLIKEKAVTEKERALIINSLFSRSDTGLLKNDSTPVMSGNVSELVQVMTNN